MLSKAKIKFIKSLQIKKYRKQEQCFIVEGAKSVRELLASDFEVQTLIGTPEFLSTVRPNSSVEVIPAAIKDLQGLGEFQTNDTAVAVARLKTNDHFTVDTTEYALILDDIRDPGNLGTIIRTADWFGLKKIVASNETADFYNQKVINATMGSFTRVKVFYTDLAIYLNNATLPIYGTYLNGNNITTMNFGAGGLILIGNESKGIAANLEEFVTHKVTIPKIGQAESINAAIAAGILCYVITGRR
jgi:RNA methyltransferase, TrmH family